MTSSRRAIPKQASVWDERRNTSRVHPVPPDALPAALTALTAFRRNFPREYDWIAEGCPRLTEREHFRRFGVPYARRRAAK